MWWSVITTSPYDGTEVRLVGCRRCVHLFQRPLVCLNLVLPHCGAEAGREDRNPGVCFTTECCTADTISALNDTHREEREMVELWLMKIILRILYKK